MNEIENISSKCSWEVEEKRLFSKICKNDNIMKQMDKKTIRHSHIFKSIVEKLEEHGYKKTASQAQLKFKSLKLRYFVEKKKLGKSGGAGCAFIFMDLMKQLLDSRPTSLSASQYGVDLCDTEVAEQPNLEDHLLPEIIEQPIPTQELNSSFNKEHSKGKGSVGGRTKYEKVISTFAEKMAKQQEELQSKIFQKHDELFEKQKKFELELQDREDERQNVFLQNISEIFNSKKYKLQKPSYIQHNTQSCRPSTSHGYQRPRLDQSAISHNECSSGVA